MCHNVETDCSIHMPYIVINLIYFRYFIQNFWEICYFGMHVMSYILLPLYFNWFISLKMQLLTNLTWIKSILNTYKLMLLFTKFILTLNVNPLLHIAPFSYLPKTKNLWFFDVSSGYKKRTPRSNGLKWTLQSLALLLQALRKFSIQNFPLPTVFCLWHELFCNWTQIKLKSKRLRDRVSSLLCRFA